MFIGPRQTLEIAEGVDRDAELEVAVVHGEDEHTTYIDKSDAIEIVKHLNNVYKLGITMED